MSNTMVSIMCTFYWIFLKASCNKQHDSIYYVNGLLATRYCLTMLWLAVLRYTVWDLHRFVLVSQHFGGGCKQKRCINALSMAKRLN